MTNPFKLQQQRLLNHEQPGSDSDIEFITISFCDALLDRALKATGNSSLLELLERRHFETPVYPQWIFTKASLTPKSSRVNAVYEVTKKYFSEFLPLLNKALGSRKAHTITQFLLEDESVSCCHLHGVILHPLIVAHYMNGIKHSLERIQLLPSDNTKLRLILPLAS
jgi:hypothetical protein